MVNAGDIGFAGSIGEASWPLRYSISVLGGTVTPCRISDGPGPAPLWRTISAAGAAEADAIAAAATMAVAMDFIGSPSFDVRPRPPATVGPRKLGQATTSEDRKSTRLNSSH